MAEPVSLTEESFTRGLGTLSERDTDLAQLNVDVGQPPMWVREPGFPTLVHIILEQQVSLASAKAAFDRLCLATAPLTPQGFLKLGDAILRSIGFSRQKALYGRNLAKAILKGRLNLATLHVMDDATARSELVEIKGIGPWTADIYLLMALRRPDIWPSGDLAIAVAVQEIKHLRSRPTAKELDAIGVKWQPWRAIAARILWHYYLSDRRRVSREWVRPE
jgi:DNA-3-methyladenine glycosylase II